MSLVIILVSYICLFRSMNKIMMKISSLNNSIQSSNWFCFALNSNDNNQTISLLTNKNPWILSLFILSLCGILFITIISFLFLYFSIRRLNNQFLLTSILTCISVFLIYIFIIIMLTRTNEFFCGLREFLSQLGYTLLYSSLLCHYIMQWITKRILSKRTKQFSCLLIYLLLIFIQIPIGILWWYFTIPRFCQQHITNEYPKFKQFSFQKHRSTVKLCSYQCIIDYRFYATYAYAIYELILCTLISICLFFYYYCHQKKIKNDQVIRTDNNNNRFITFFNTFGFILIDISWLIWTLVYYFAHPTFVFPSLVIGMFTIGTLSLFFILLPRIYICSRNSINDINLTNTIVFSNKLASIEDIKHHDLSCHEKSTNQFEHDQRQCLSDEESELSYEFCTSGTYLPITRTPKEPFKVINTDKTISTKQINRLIYEKLPNAVQTSNNQDKIMTTKRNENTSKNDSQEQQLKSSITSLQYQACSFV